MMTVSCWRGVEFLVAEPPSVARLGFESFICRCTPTANAFKKPSPAPAAAASIALQAANREESFEPPERAGAEITFSEGHVSLRLCT